MGLSWTRSRVVDSVLAAVATVVATWPLTTLLESPLWVNDVLLMLALVIIGGVVGRVVALRGWQVLVLQLVVVLLAVVTLYGRGHLWYGLPTTDTLRAFGARLQEAVQTVQAYTAPAPTTPGLRLVVGAGAGLVAALVDYLAVTRRAPSVAGLPLLAVYLTSAANSGSSLHPGYFVAAAAAWLVLVARQGTSVVRRWGGKVAKPLTPVRDIGGAQALGSYASVARSLGVSALLLAVLVPLFLPHFPTRYLLDGLGRSEDGVGNGAGVGFSQSLDLAADLGSRSTAPVLVYRTNDAAAPPLRVSISSRYSRGVWPATQPAGGATSANPGIPRAPGLSPDVVTTTRELVVSQNRLAAPGLAAPYPVVKGDLGVSWRVDGPSHQPVVTRRPDDYSVQYLQLKPTVEQLRQGVPGSVGDDVDTRFDLFVDPDSSQMVSELVERLTTGLSNRYDQAMAIQQYLRSDGGFTYSLTLSERIIGADGNRLDPLSNFLATKKGYCVQFATAMVMMARTLGVPARMAKGFLPGTLASGQYTVTASDAHAWPELYFPGIGWTRFEPTPSARSGSAPSYAVPTPQNVPTSAPRASDDVPAVRPTANLSDKSDDPNPGLVTPADDAANASLVRRLFTGRSLVVWAGLVGLLGALVVPSASRWRRRQVLAAARTEAEYVEAQWIGLAAQLRDLGLPPSLSLTPRQLRAYYADQAHLDRDSSQALARVIGQLEAARYAAPSRSGLALDSEGYLADIDPDARQVLRGVASTRPWPVRLRALLWPQSGRRQLRDVTNQVMGRVREPWEDALARFRQSRRVRSAERANRRR